MANFNDILNRPVEAIEAPKPIPVGTYLALINAQPIFAKIGKNQTDCVNFPIIFQQPQDDVDVAALNESLARADGVSKSLSDVKSNIRQFLTEDSLWRVKAFLVDHLGIEETGKTLGQMIPEAMGRQVLVTVKHRLTDGDNPQVMMDIAGTAKV